MTVALTLALAHAAPFAVGPPPCERLPVVLPAGATSTIVAREMAKPRPSGVTFAVEGSPTVADGKLVLHGVLANTGTRPATVYLVSAPHTCGPFLVAPRAVPYAPKPRPGAPPPMPEVVPAPEELVLPPGARVAYDTAITLADWGWQSGAPVTLDWTFAFWGDALTGEVAGQMKR